MSKDKLFIKIWNFIFSFDENTMVKLSNFKIQPVYRWIKNWNSYKTYNIKIYTSVFWHPNSSFMSFYIALDHTNCKMIYQMWNFPIFVEGQFFDIEFVVNPPEYILMIDFFWNSIFQICNYTGSFLFVQQN